MACREQVTWLVSARNTGKGTVTADWPVFASVPSSESWGATSPVGSCGVSCGAGFFTPPEEEAVVRDAVAAVGADAVAAVVEDAVAAVGVDALTVEATAAEAATEAAAVFALLCGGDIFFCSTVMFLSVSSTLGLCLGLFFTVA